MIFFGTVRLFFETFLMSQRVPPLNFLLICNRMQVYKSKKVPLLYFSALCDIFRKRKIFENFKFFSKKNVLRFLSLRYRADFRRSCLVSICLHFDAIVHCLDFLGIATQFKNEISIWVAYSSRQKFNPKKPQMTIKIQKKTENRQTFSVFRSKL